MEFKKINFAKLLLTETFDNSKKNNLSKYAKELFFKKKDEKRIKIMPRKQFFFVFVYFIYPPPPPSLN